MCVCVCVCVIVGVCIHTHTYIYIYIYICSLILLLARWLNVFNMWPPYIFHSFLNLSWIAWQFHLPIIIEIFQVVVLVSQILLDNSTSPSVVSETCDASSPVKLCFWYSIITSFTLLCSQITSFCLCSCSDISSMDLSIAFCAVTSLCSSFIVVAHVNNIYIYIYIYKTFVV